MLMKRHVRKRQGIRKMRGRGVQVMAKEKKLGGRVSTRKYNAGWRSTHVPPNPEF